MEKLEMLLQEMVVRRFGQKAWLLIQRQSLLHGEFDEHIESYGAQRVPALGLMVPGLAGEQRLSPESRILDAAARLMGTTASGLLQELGGDCVRGDLQHTQ